MDHLQNGKIGAYLIGGAIFLVILALRMRRMMQSRPFRIQFVWVLPVIFITLMVLTMTASPPHGREWIWIAGSLAIGAGLGWFRAKTIRLVVDPVSRQIMAQGSPLAMVFILVIFAVRFGLRSVLLSESSALGVSIALVDTAFLAMACGLFVLRAAEMGLRAFKLLALEPPKSAPL